MHSHERFEEGPDWGRGRRGRGRGWYGGPWAGPGDIPGPMQVGPGGPNRMWFYGGGPFGPGAGLWSRRGRGLGRRPRWPRPRRRPGLGQGKARRYP